MSAATRPRPELSVVIPAYNEEERIEGVLKGYADFYESYEIIVVCNGCSDSTPEIVGDWARRDPRIKVLNFDEKLGKGGAIIEGLKAAEGELIGFLDADESVDAREYLKLVRTIKKSNAGGVIASRRVEGANILVQQSLTRRIASKAFNLLVRSISGLEFQDTQCGAKVFRGKVVKEVINELSSRGYEFDVEILWKLRNKGCSIHEVPIDWKHSGASKFSLLNAPRMLAGLIKIRLKESS